MSTLTYRQREFIESLLSRERGTVIKPFGSRLSAAICFPNQYYLGASNLGVHFLYREINSREDWLAERVFTDISPSVSLENQRPLSDFDVIIFTVPFELDFANVLKMLVDAGIEPESEKRGSDDPLIIAGGVAVSMNPRPLWRFMDIMVVAEGEAALPKLLAVLSETSADKSSFLKAMEDEDGVITSRSSIQENDTKGSRIHCQELSEPVYSVFLSPDTEFKDTCLVELARGCPFSCAFCYIGNTSGPFRPFPAESVIRTIEKNMHRTRRFGLVSSAVGSHAQLEEICNFCLERGLNISFSSLRADALTEPLMKILLESGQKTLTIAPETGSENLRRKLRKSLSCDQIITSVKKAMNFGFENIKLYFILGLPGETEDDLEETTTMIKDIREIVLREGKKRGKVGNIIVSFSFFVPKPGTPLEKEPAIDVSEMKKKQRLMLKQLRPLPHVSVLPADPHSARAQALLSSGGKETGEFLLNKIKRRLSWKTALSQYKP